MDKSASFTIAQLRDVLATVDWTLYDYFQLISDVGTHFRSYIVLGTLAHQIMRDFKAIKALHVLYGPEEHSKMDVDRLFSELREAARTTSMETEIIDDADLVACYRKWWDTQTIIDPSKPKADFVLYEPSLWRTEVELSRFDEKSLPCALKACHRWSFIRADKRTVNHVVKGKLTGVKVSAKGFVGDKLKAYDTSVKCEVVDWTAKAYDTKVASASVGGSSSSSSGGASGANRASGGSR